MKMNNVAKHICELEYCKKHSSCIFKNAESLLKTDSYIVALGSQECSDRILCYQKENIGFKPYERSVSVNTNQEPERTCVKCDSKNNLKYHHFAKNPRILLCEDCDRKIHQHRSNYELATYFNTKTKIISLLNVIEEIEKGSRPELINKLQNSNLNRCANIYCGTLSDITRHHLIPKPYRRGLCTPTDKIPLCRTCHDRVHRLKTNKQLAKHYNTREAVIQLLASDVDFRKERFINVSNEQYKYQTMVA